MCIRDRPGDEQRRQAKAVGDDRSGALGDPVPDPHAQQRTGHDRDDVDDRAQAREGDMHGPHPMGRVRAAVAAPNPGVPVGAEEY